MYVWFKLLMALMLVALNGFFVLAEFAIVKVRRTRLEELTKQGNSVAKVALKISTSLDSYLSAIQLGITLASLALGWLGEPALVTVIEPLFIKYLGIDNAALMHTISIAIAFTLITLFHVVLGELIPKSLAIQRAESMALYVAWPLYIFHKIAYPIVWIFDRIAALGLRIIGLTPGQEHEQAHSEEELRMIISSSHTGGQIDDTEGQLLDNVFMFSQKKVHEIMVPRTDMICIYLDDTYEESKEIILKSGFTRFPLCKEEKDDIIGMIHLRDLLKNETKEYPNKDLSKIVREVLFIPETLTLASVLHLMKNKRIHLAVIIDEYGGTAGLISMEDILEEIVGEIQDEYDGEAKGAVKLDEHTYELSGLFLQADFEKLTGVNLADQDDETIGGLVFSLLGRKAEVGDIVQWSNYNFEVTSVDNLRIDKVKIYPVEKYNWRG